MAKSDFTTGNFDYLAKGIEDYFNSITEDVVINRERALDEASDYLLKQLENNTPVGKNTPDARKHTRDSWERSTKYKGVRYINNTAVNKQGIPIVNLLEYAEHKGHPFVRKTYDNSLREIENIMIKNLVKENNNGY